MRVLLLLLLTGCGEAATIELDPPMDTAPIDPEPSADAGTLPRFDAGLPVADIVPIELDFGEIYVGAHSDRTVQAINRNNQSTVVFAQSESDQFLIVGSSGWELSPRTRRDILIRFAPLDPGIHDDILTVDACGAGCIVQVRLVGKAD